ncbi:MAG TPA: GIY-YIG nuclease family protein [Terriglobales bacterium]|jgi:predicted GIY-YIG superfamily endonuclease
MHYVYLLQSHPHPSHHYIGVTHDLRSRLAEHNRGKLPTTAHSKPWRLTAYAAFPDPLRALAFERYLKSGSGHAFAHKHS